MNKVLKKIDGVQYINAKELWGSIVGIQSCERMRGLMTLGGVRFFDADRFLIAEPSINIVGFGGFPVLWGDKTPLDHIELSVAEGKSFHPSAVNDAFADMMGLSGFC